VSALQYEGTNQGGEAAQLSDMMDFTVVGTHVLKRWNAGSLINIGNLCYRYSNSVTPSNFRLPSNSNQGGRLMKRQDFSPHGSPYNILTPESTNRNDYYNVRCATPLSANAIQMAKLDPLFVRELEKNQCELAHRLNQQSGYISRSAIYWKTVPEIVPRERSEWESWRAQKF
jgi:hypothetical protein